MENYDDGDGEIDFHEFQEMVMKMRSFKEAGIKNSLEDAHFIESTMGDVYKFRVEQQAFSYLNELGLPSLCMCSCVHVSSLPRLPAPDRKVCTCGKYWSTEKTNERR